ncbi:MAG: glycosyltransferase [Spirochaetes bacterium]|nr:glycosyltransferase [Spirochaetota bacterium]
MTVLAIHNYYKLRGGEDAVFENETLLLEKSGHRVIKYIKNNSEIDNYTFLKKIKFLFKCIYNSETICELKKIVKENKIDIVHVHNVFPLISPSIYAFFHKNKIRVVQTVHNYRFICPNGLFFTHKEKCTRCIKGNFLNCIILRCYKDSIVFSILYALIIFLNQVTFREKIAKYIVLTQFVKDIFIQAGFDAKKIYIKDNGLIDKKIKRNKNKDYFLFLGRISFEKGIDFLMESFLKMPEYNLMIAGTGDNLEYYKSKYNYQNIKFKGFVKDEEKIELLRQASALIVPSIWYENYPVTVIEAFSCGIPVIASNIGGLSYIIEDGVDGLLFKMLDYDSLKKNIELINNNDFRKKIGDNARNTFLKKMEMSENIKRLIEIYED